MTTLSSDELAEIRRLHVPTMTALAGEWCYRCNCGWPCDASRLLDQAEEAARLRDALDGELLANYFVDAEFRDTLHKMVDSLEDGDWASLTVKHAAKLLTDAGEGQ